MMNNVVWGRNSSAVFGRDLCLKNCNFSIWGGIAHSPTINQSNVISTVIQLSYPFTVFTRRK